MNITLLWHGSEIAGVAQCASTLTLRFAAAHVRCAAAQGADATEEGHLRPLVLTFQGACVQGDVAGAMGSLAEGLLHHQQRALASVPLPLALQGGVRAELIFHNGTVLEIVADAAECRPGPDSRFHESLAC